MSVTVVRESIETVSERERKTVRCDGPGCAWSMRLEEHIEPRSSFAHTHFRVQCGDGWRWAEDEARHFCSAACLELWAHREMRSPVPVGVR